MFNKKDCGCDCDHTTWPIRQVNPEMTKQEMIELLEQKISRMRRQHQMMDKTQDQLESD